MAIRAGNAHQAVEAIITTGWQGEAAMRCRAGLPAETACS
jgi:hypothetical protein